MTLTEAQVSENIGMHYPDGFITMSLEARIDAALERIRSGQATMRIPADQTDPDLVLAECKKALAQIRAQENGTGSEAATLVRAPIDQSVTPAPAAPLKLIGEVTKYGVVWADQNPHAHPLGTKFYAAGKETNCASETRPEVTRPETLAPAAPTHDALDGLAAKAKEYARRGDDCGALAREIISALRQSGAGRDVERYRIICENAWADQVEHNSWYLAVDIPLNHGGTLTKEHIDSAVDALKERT